MAVELTVPQVGESITEVQIGQWHKQEGEAVAKGDILVEIETDKVTVELPAPAEGRMGKVLKQAGEKAQVGEVIGHLESSSTANDGADAPKHESRELGAGKVNTDGGPARDVGSAVAKVPAPGRATQTPTAPIRQKPAASAMPGKAVQAPVSSPGSRTGSAMSTAELSDAAPEKGVTQQEAAKPPTHNGERTEQVVPMSPLRRRIAERLLQAQQAAALLTTFNEVDMSAVMALRAKHQDTFVKRHNIKLGFSSFFVKATIDALKRFPQLNAEIRGTDIIFRDYYDIGMAVSTEKGLVVPVLANAEHMSFADIELAVADFAARARDNKLKLSELEGGTFTITNGGVFGSLLSTPIINPPQSGILGLHAIQDRPVARDGQVVIRPMMYLALTYDHRIVDGREAVSFLRRIKEVVEEPARMLVEI